MSSYALTVVMNSTTVVKLKMLGYVLYAFAAVQASSYAYPVVVYKSSDYSAQTVIRFEPTLMNAYLSTTPVQPGHVVLNGQVVAIKLGELTTIDQSGLFTPPVTGLHGAVVVYNGSARTYTTGITIDVDGWDANAVALAVPAKLSQTFVPYPRVVVMFSSRDHPLNEMLERVGDPCFSIEFSGATDRQVNYDADTGWSASGSFATLYEPPVDLRKLLILRLPAFLLNANVKFVHALTRSPPPQASRAR